MPDNLCLPRQVASAFPRRAGRALAGIAILAMLMCVRANAADDLEARRQRIADMSLAEQQQLLRNQQRFNELSAADQDRMRKLDAALQADPDRQRLQEVLERYHEWLKTLSPEKRAELDELGYEARVQRIRELMARQRDEHNRRRPHDYGPPLPKEDQQAIYQWFGDLVWTHRRQILEELPQTHRKPIERLDEAAQRKALLLAAIQRTRGERLPIEPADYERLLKVLTPETRARLADAPTPQQKQRLAREWIGQAVVAHIGWHAMRRAMANASGEELQGFFKKLPSADRERLLRMPRDQMQDELRQLYLQRENRPDGPPGGRPPFDRHRPPFGRPSFEYRGPPDRQGPEQQRRPRGSEHPPGQPPGDTPGTKEIRS